MNTPPDRALEGRKGLVVGIANAHSIAFGCALSFRRLGAEVAVTNRNDKARPHVEPLATGAPGQCYKHLGFTHPHAIGKLGSSRMPSARRRSWSVWNEMSSH